MSVIRVILAIIFPPLAVVDKGCGSFLIVFILTLMGWINVYKSLLSANATCCIRHSARIR